MALSRKEYRRQEAAILIDEAALDGVRVRYLPSFRTIKCDYCGHSGRARIPYGTKTPRFRCSQCKKTH